MGAYKDWMKAGSRDNDHYSKPKENVVPPSVAERQAARNAKVDAELDALRERRLAKEQSAPTINLG